MIGTLREIFSHTLSHEHEMEDLINKNLMEAIKIINQPSGKFLMSKSLYNSYLNTSDITDEIVKKFISKMPPLGYIGTNPFFNLLFLYLLTFLVKENYSAAKSTSRFLAAFHLSYLKKKYFHVMNDDVMRYTLANLHGHSVARQGFAALCIKVADETLAKYQNELISKIDTHVYYRYMIDVRNKLNQSMKAIARKYYLNMEKTVGESQEDLANKIVNSYSSVLYNPDILSYISKMSEMSDFEIEHILIRIQHDSGATELLKNLILKILYKYGDADKLNEIGIATVIGRAKRTGEIISLCSNIYEEINFYDVTISHITVLITVSVLLIISNR